MLRRVLLLSMVAAAALVPRSVSAQQTRQFGSFSATTSVAFSLTKTADARHAAIAWRCMTDGLNIIYLIGGEPVGREMDRELAVVSTADDGEGHVRTWTLLEGHRAAFLPRASVEEFTTEALAANRLLLHTTDPVSGQTFTDEFTLDGLRGALQYILPCEF